MPERDDIPEATAERDDEPALAELVLGEPFAIAHDASLLKPNPGEGIPGCFATLQCDSCGQVFKIDLLAPGYKRCPGCKMKYTHVLAIGEDDDNTLVEEVLDTVFASNGVRVPGGGDDDDDPDDEQAPSDDDEHAAEVVDDDE